MSQLSLAGSGSQNWTQSGSSLSPDAIPSMSRTNSSISYQQAREKEHEQENGDFEEDEATNLLEATLGQNDEEVEEAMEEADRVLRRDEGHENATVQEIQEVRLFFFI